MKVLVVSNGFPPRGVFGTEFYTHELAHGLLRRGHAVTVLHPERSGRAPRYSLERLVEDGIALALLHNPGDPRKRFESSYRDAEVERRFDELLAAERPDLVHFTYLLWGLSLRLPEIARARGVPSVLTLTDYGLLCHRGQMFDWRLATCGGPHPAEVCARCVRHPAPHDHPPLGLLLRRTAAEVLAAAGGLGRVPVRADLERREEEVRRALALCARLIAPTRSLLEVHARAGVAREKLVHLVYAFDESGYRDLARPAHGARVRFGFLGQFAPHKGLACLLAAARHLEELAPRADWEVVLHGGPSSGRHRLYAGRVLAELGSARVRVEKAFPSSEAPRVLAGLAALVAPSEWDENAPLAVLQARAAGVPVLATDVPGIAEVVRSGSQGLLVPVGDARALARAMRDVLEGRLRAPLDPGLPLSLAAHLDRLEALYAEVRSAPLRAGGAR